MRYLTIFGTFYTHHNKRVGSNKSPLVSGVTTVDRMKGMNFIADSKISRIMKCGIIKMARSKGITNLISLLR